MPKTLRPAAQPAGTGISGFCSVFLCVGYDASEQAGALICVSCGWRAHNINFFLCALSDAISKHFPSCSHIRRAALASGLIGTPEVQSRVRHGAEVSSVKALV